MTQALATRDMNTLPALSAGSVDAYISAVNQIPMLTPEEELKLGERLHDDGDTLAAKRLILSHLRFVVHVARGYTGYGLALPDLIQEGNVGLMKAVKRYDPAHGVRLVSFAVHWIKAEIHEFVIRNWRIVKVATTKAQRKLFFNLRSSKKRLGWFTQDEVNAVANDLGVTPEQVLEMENRLSAHDSAFDPVGPDEDEDTPFAPAAYLEDHSHDPARRVEQDDWDKQNVNRLTQALAGLDERSRDILQQRWLNENKATLHQLADQYGVSAERIRQLENNAIKKLRGSFAA